MDYRSEEMLTADDKCAILRTVSIFRGIPDAVLEQILPLLHRVELAAGEALFAIGEMGSAMYIVVEGQLRVHNRDYTLNYLGPGDVFGETSLLESTPRTASVTAVQGAHRSEWQALHQERNGKMALQARSLAH